MTAQKGDIYKLDGKEYELIAMSAPPAFYPQDHGIVPGARCSACWAGYWCEYAVKDGRLYLENLFINSDGDHYPPINGIEASLPGTVKAESYSTKTGQLEQTEVRGSMGHHVYRGINLPVDYTGGVLVGSGPGLRISHLMRLRRSSFGLTQLELVFEKGVLVHAGPYPGGDEEENRPEDTQGVSAEEDEIDRALEELFQTEPDGLFSGRSED